LDWSKTIQKAPSLLKYSRVGLFLLFVDNIRVALVE